jgi:hypothetical protein
VTGVAPASTICDLDLTTTSSNCFVETSVSLFTGFVVSRLPVWENAVVAVKKQRVKMGVRIM